MGLEQIVKRIQDEARKEADGYLAEARAKSRAIDIEAEKALKKDLEGRGRELKRDLETIRNIYISDGKRKARQALLSSKEELIWSAICAIREAIKALPRDDLKAYLGSMMEKAGGILGDDLRSYPVREIDREILSSVNDVGPLVSEAGNIEPLLERYTGIDLLGGFIAVGSDGQKVMDMTFHGVLERKEEMLRETIARTLFPEE
ncbi:MAG: V-type ATP synthase subunit E [Candidatus Thermoplasmatota archaeon]|nr:V-type ATP synthase subunit E [Candidatus Thermoplasmatota archaeon]